MIALNLVKQTKTSITMFTESICSDSAFPNSLARVVDCHPGVLGLNPGGPKIFSPWNYFTGG